MNIAATTAPQAMGGNPMKDRSENKTIPAMLPMMSKR